MDDPDPVQNEDYPNERLKPTELYIKVKLNESITWPTKLYQIKGRPNGRPKSIKKTTKIDQKDYKDNQMDPTKIEYTTNQRTDQEQSKSPKRTTD